MHSIGQSKSPIWTDKWLKGFWSPSTYAWDISNQSPDTRFESPCKETDSKPRDHSLAQPCRERRSNFGKGCHKVKVVLSRANVFLHLKFAGILYMLINQRPEWDWRGFQTECTWLGESREGTSTLANDKISDIYRPTDTIFPFHMNVCLCFERKYQQRSLGDAMCMFHERPLSTYAWGEAKGTNVRLI